MPSSDDTEPIAFDPDPTEQIFNEVPPWGTFASAPVTEKELRLRVYDDGWDATTWDRVTGINISDTGLLLIQGNIVVGPDEFNTALAAFAPGFWSMYRIMGADEE